ncbi:MAG: N-acetylmuramoyl-L-alanine amidase [Succinivibrio sp.]|nr:N-acetylmuramoyl-L-alanine amidase [Succinivibrio sp.]
MFIILMCGHQTFALEIEGMRAYSNNDKTRIVIDLDEKAVYTTAYHNKDNLFIIRIKNVSEPKVAPQGVKLSNKSSVSGVTRVLDGQDVRYLFTTKSGYPPQVFTLAPRADNQNFRIVLDFVNIQRDSSPSPQKKTERAPSSSANASESLPAVHSNSSLATQERDLFIAYSTEGKDGIRSMSPSQAKEYNEKLKELRARYAKQQQEAKADEKKAKSEARNQTAGKGSDTVQDSAAPPEPVEVKSVDKPFIIAVDPGHGGKDPGAIGKHGVREKNVTLAIAKALAGYINSNKIFRAVLVRDRDVFVDLDRRSEIARKKKADILISIHADSVASSSSSARGVSVWVLSGNRAERENKKLLRDNKQNRLIGGAGEVISESEQNPYLAATILDMSSSTSRSEGYLLGNEILNSLGKFTRLRKTSPIHASLAVLKAPDIPSLLIETGFLSNSTEELQLSKPNYQKQIAYHIFKGIEEYYRKYPAKKIETRRETARRANAGSVITVKKGDSLSLIARRYGTTVAALRKTNSLKSDVLKVGQELVLPK